MRKGYLDYLKAFSILFVVAGHSMAYYAEQVAPLDFGWWIVQTLMYAVHVPTFFVVAGYLCHPQPLAAYGRKKLLRVLVPYLVFALTKGVSELAMIRGFQDMAAVRSQLYDIFVTGRKYWFCPAILRMYILAPLFWEREGRPALRYVAIGVFLWLLVLNTAFSLGLPVPSFLGGGIRLSERWQLRRTFQYAPFFLGGMILRQWEDRLSPLTEKHGRVLALFSVGMAAVGMNPTVLNNWASTILINYLVGTPLMFLMYLAARRLPRQIRPLQAIGGWSLQLMLLDSFYKVALFYLAGRLLPLNVWAALAIAGCNVLLGCLTCMAGERIPPLGAAMGLSRAPVRGKEAGN